jgi:hypothetical protein
VRKLGINIIRKITLNMARQISLTIGYEFRDMVATFVVRETIASEVVAVVVEVLLRKSGETILGKNNSSHFIFLLKSFRLPYP